MQETAKYQSRGDMEQVSAPPLKSLSSNYSLAGGIWSMGELYHFFIHWRSFCCIMAIRQQKIRKLVA
jgi:hypothetical protein